MKKEISLPGSARGPRLVLWRAAQDYAIVSMDKIYACVLIFSGISWFCRCAL
jgi:hypothetical protein